MKNGEKKGKKKEKKKREETAGTRSQQTQARRYVDILGDWAKTTAFVR